MTLSRLLVALCLACVMMAAVALPVRVPPTPTALADHNEPGSGNLIDNYIARNIVLGHAILVCSHDYPISTEKAVTRWNDKWGDFFGPSTVLKPTTLFRFVELDSGGDPVDRNDPECEPKAVRPSFGIGSVLVLKDADECNTGACMLRLGLASSLQAPLPKWDTIQGQPKIYVADYKTAATSRMLLDDDEDRVTRSITHELGHVLGFEDYSIAYCRALEATGTTQSDHITIMSGGERYDGNRNFCFADEPSENDRDDYEASYIPGAPKDVAITSKDANTVKLT